MSGGNKSAREAEAVALVARAREGDSEALGELYRRYRSSAVGFAARRAEPADAEDVVQEAFIQLPEIADSFDPARSEVGAWLCGYVTRRALIDYGRQHYFRQRAAADVARDAVLREPTESAYARESRPLSTRVVTALARLTPAQRRDMQLRFLDGLSATAAAAVAKSSPGAVAKNCVAARKQLRAALADLAPRRTPWLEGMSKKDAVHAAFEAVGELDAPAACSWLRERGVQVTQSYVYQIRNGRHGPAPLSTTGHHRADVAGAGDGPSVAGLVPEPTVAGDDRLVAEPAASQQGETAPRVTANVAADEVVASGPAGGSWEVARAASAGDRAAFGQLYAHYHPRVAGLVRRSVGDEALAEDLTSETFARALARIDTVSERAGRDPGAWLSTIASNLVRDHAKSAHTQRSQAVEEIPEPRVADTGEGSAETEALDRIGRAETREAVRRAVAALRPAHRDAAQAVMEDRPAAEQAASTGVSRGSAWAMRQRAMTALREHFAREGVTSSWDCAGAPAPRPCDPAHAKTVGRDEAEREDTEAEPTGLTATTTQTESAERRAAVDRARRAVEHATEQRAEQAAGGDEAARAEQLTRWHADDQAAQAEDTTRAADDWAGDSYGLEGAGR